MFQAILSLIFTLFLLKNCSDAENNKSQLTSPTLVHGVIETQNEADLLSEATDQEGDADIPRQTGMDEGNMTEETLASSAGTGLDKTARTSGAGSTEIGTGLETSRKFSRGLFADNGNDIKTPTQSGIGLADTDDDVETSRISGSGLSGAGIGVEPYRSGAGLAGAGNGIATSESKARISEIMDYFCPGADVCQNSSLKIANQNIFPPGKESCCRACSCEADCLKNNDCCFPSKKTEKNTFPQVCMFPFVSVNEEDIKYPAFKRYLRSYTFKTDLKQSQNNSGKFLRDSCADRDVAPWGSFYPVYSKATGKLYYNTFCALSHDVIDSVVWDAKIDCIIQNSHEYHDVSLFFEWLTQGKLSEICRVTFIHPGDAQDIFQEECFIDLISECSASNFALPPSSPLSQSEVVDLCKSGMHSPYMLGDSFVNVFCSVCNNRFSVSTFCDTPDRESKRTDIKNFGYLLNHENIGSIHSESEGRVQRNKLRACPVVSLAADDECRDILCPSGQIRHPNGSCVFLAQKWFVPKLEIALKLTPDRPELLQEVLSGREFDINALKSPWLSVWKIYTVLFFTGYLQNGEITDDSTEYMWIILHRVPLIKTPAEFLSKLHSLLSKTWRYNAKNEIIRFKNEIMPFDEVYRNDQGHMVPIYNNKPFENAIPTYDIAYVPKGRSLSATRITKLMFCEQIELFENEYELLFENLLYYKSRDIYFYQNEFAISFNGNARICLQYSGYRRTTSSAASFSLRNLLGTWILSLTVISFSP